MNRVTARTVLGILFLLALCGGALYIFPSGMPQPADLLWVLWVPTCIVLGARASLLATDGRGRAIILIVTVLTFWIVLTALGNAFVASDLEIAFFATYYIFNAFVFSCVLLLGHRSEKWFRQYVLIAAKAGLVVVGLLLLVNFDTSAARQSGSFNNPNQLAYFSLLLGAVFVVVASPSVIASLQGMMFLFLTLVAVGFSASLTAMASLMMVITAAAIKAGRVRILLRLVAVASIAVAIGGGLVMTTGVGDQLSQTVITRFNALERKTANVSAERGYDRIIEFPEYALLGAGEGARWRFGHQHERIEIHSTWGTLLFSYGIPGLTIFIVLIVLLLRGQPYWVAVVLSGPFIYGVTHQGLRSTLFWVLLACVAWAAPNGSGYFSRSATRKRLNEVKILSERLGCRPPSSASADFSGRRYAQLDR